MSENNSFQPDWVSAPGSTIVDILEQKEMSVEEFAKLLGYSVERAGKLLSGRIVITADVARLLAKTIGGSSEFWISREEQFRADLSKLQATGDASASKLWLNELPLRDMVQFGWIDEKKRLEDQVSECLRFFNVSDVANWRNRYNVELAAVSFRTSPTFESQPGSVLAWLRYGEIKSAAIDCKPWDRESFQNSLGSIRKLTRFKEPESFLPELQNLCAECGVAVVVARAPLGCRASGATKFISPEKAMILLSFRYLSDDQFWFTFFHEAGHLVLHSDKALFLEDGSDVTLVEEAEANRFAEKILIPDHLRSFMPDTPISREDISRASVRIGVSRGIVVGQLQHFGRIDRKKYNWMKRRFRWSEKEA